MGVPLSAIQLLRMGQTVRFAPQLIEKYTHYPFYTQLFSLFKIWRRVLSLLVRGLGGTGAVPLFRFVRTAVFVLAFLCLFRLPVFIKDERRELCNK